MASTTLRERGRITARVPKSVEDKLQAAAELVGASMNQFVVQAALREAERVMERERLITLSATDADLVFRLMDEPFKPNSRLKRALARYKEFRRYGTPGHRAARQEARPRPVRLRR